MVEEGAAGSAGVAAESGRVMLVGRSWFRMGEGGADEPVEGDGAVGRPMGRTKTSPLGVKMPVSTGVMVAPSLFEPGQPEQPARRAAEDEPVTVRSLRFSWPLLGLVFASALTASAITGAVIWRLRPAPAVAPVVAVVPAPPPAPKLAPAPDPAPASAPPSVVPLPTQPAAAPVVETPAVVGAVPEGTPAAPEPEAPRPIAPPAARRARSAAPVRRPAVEPTFEAAPAAAAPKRAWVDPFAD